MDEHLVVGGDFLAVGMTVATGLAIQDPVSGQWSALGTFERAYSSAWISCLNVDASGNLVVAGQFDTVDGVLVNNIARFDGSTWSPMANGSSSRPLDICIWNGQIVATGQFNGSHGVHLWDGVNWQRLGGTFNQAPYTLQEMPNGDLFAGGGFSSIGGVNSPRAVRWDGSAWSQMPNPGAALRSSTTYNGDLVVGLYYSTNPVRRWTGTGWVTMQAQTSQEYVARMMVTSNGDLLASFGAGSVVHLRRWNGVSAWQDLGTLDGEVVGFDEDAHGTLFVGGNIWSAGGIPIRNLAKYESGQWSAVFTGGANDQIVGFARGPDGQVLAYGRFTRIGGVPANRIAMWDGTNWSPLGNGVANGFVQAAVFLPNGDLVVAGGFTEIGGTTAGNIAVWNGSSWAAVGAGTTNTITGLGVAPNGDLIAGTYGWTGIGSYVIRWDGASWSAVGSLSAAPYLGMAVAPSGDIFAFSDESMWHWDHTDWTEMVDAEVFCMAVAPNGDLVFGGNFHDGSLGLHDSVYRWNGSNWQAYGDPLNHWVYDLDFLPDGSLLAVGGFSASGSTPIEGVARWDGSAWTQVDGGASNWPKTVFAMADGSAIVSGDTLQTAGNVSPPSPFVAHLEPACPATVTDLGGGCTSSGGANVLQADNHPWVGQTFTTRGSELPTFAFIMATTGFSQMTTPLPALMPQGVPGCELLVSSDIVETLISNNGEVVYDLPVPNLIGLVGLPFYQQLIAIDVDMGLMIQEVTSTNALATVVGAL